MWEEQLFLVWKGYVEQDKAGLSREEREVCKRIKGEQVCGRQSVMRSLTFIVWKDHVEKLKAEGTRKEQRAHSLEEVKDGLEERQ